MPVSFPGAEGYGADTRGAYAGSTNPTIYVVSNLNESGAGSFRDAVEANGPRVIVFNVGGVIPVKNTIEIENPYCTILGQTAPFPGITLKRTSSDDYPIIDVNEEQVIIRYIRMKHGEHRSNPGHSGDVMQVGRDGGNVYDVIIDHCELWWGTDETFATYNENHRVTFQWSIIGDPIHQGGQEEELEDGHGFGTTMTGQDGTSLHHCLFMNVSGRHPRFNTEYAETGEFIANVHYNPRWEDNGYGPMYVRSLSGGPEQNVNVKNAYVIVGPDRTTDEGYFMSFGRRGGPVNIYHDGIKLINSETGGDVTDSGGYSVVDSGTVSKVNIVGSPRPVAHSNPVTEEADADAAYEAVMACVGVTVPGRDNYAVDRLAKVEDYTGRYLIYSEDEAGSFPTQPSDPAWVDSDGDGIPDYYEFEKSGSNTGLNPTDLAPSGYMWIEEWANSLVSGDCTQETQPPIGEDITCPLEDVSVNLGNTQLYDLNATRLFAGDFDAVVDYDYQAALRYQLDADPNATFSNASVRLYVTSVNGADVAMQVYGVLEPDATPFGTEANTKTRITNLTTAMVAFNIPAATDNAFITTPDISDIVEELVAQGGWSSGNTIMLVFKDAVGFGVQARAKFASVNDGNATCPKLSYTVGSSLIDANFSFTPTTGLTNQNVTFTDLSSATNGITNWSWAFGDGGVSTNQNPQHSYASVGVYQVKLIVTGPDGSDEITKSITITSSGSTVSAASSNAYNINGHGTVTLLSSHPSWVDLMGTNYNLMGTLAVSYNVFTGLGQAWDSVNEKMLTWNIDTGVYEITDSTGNISYNGGTDARLAMFGTKHGGGRGEPVWDAWQAEQATLYPTWTIQPWSVMFERQYQEALLLV